MAMTIAEATILAAATIVPFGTYTETAPAPAGNGATVGPFADYANTFAFRITNGTTPPGAPLVLVFYAVSAAGRLYEIDRVSGDVVTNSVISGAIPCPAGFPNFTAKAFGNTTQNVAVEVYLERQVP